MGYSLSEYEVAGYMTLTQVMYDTHRRLGIAAGMKLPINFNFQDGSNIFYDIEEVTADVIDAIPNWREMSLTMADMRMSRKRVQEFLTAHEQFVITNNGKPRFYLKRQEEADIPLIKEYHGESSRCLAANFCEVVSTKELCGDNPEGFHKWLRNNNAFLRMVYPIQIQLGLVALNTGDRRSATPGYLVRICSDNSYAVFLPSVKDRWVYGTNFRNQVKENNGVLLIQCDSIPTERES